MSTLDFKAYSSILRIKPALRFDVGTLLMRLFAYTTTVGTITMLTLAGSSALEATSVSSLLAICTFAVAPRVSKRIDERGQSAVVPAATAIAMAGFVLLLVTTHFGLPFWLNYPAAALASFLPNAAALVRTRWTYLIATRKFGDDTPPLKTAYAFEGILEDVAFMVGPAAVIAISAALFPTAGLLVGAALYCVGALLLVRSKDTEPEPGWGADSEAGPARKSMFSESAVVRLLFFVMVLIGCMYGAFDATIVSYSESIDFALLASIVFAIESLFSLVMSTLFGMLTLSMPIRRQFVLFAVLFGVLYGLVVLVDSPMSLVVIVTVAGLAYPPLLITCNVVCEHASPSERLTESMAWMNSGISIGMVVGPVSAGALFDTAGPIAPFDLCGGFAILVAVAVLACIPVLRKRL